MKILNFIYVADEIMELLDLLDYIYKRACINKRLFVEYEECLCLYRSLHCIKYKLHYMWMKRMSKSRITSLKHVRSSEMARVCNYVQRKRWNNAIVRLFSAKVSPNLKSPVQVDLIGPPDPISNLRPIIFAKSENESKLEKEFREAREDTQIWNQNFWTEHNDNFRRERRRFQETLKAQGKTSITADDMSMFYKEFLDKNWQMHFNYNIAWYKRNIKLLLLEIRVRISKLKFR